ncbi:MAG: indolepyruvate ferredoxin oxidoreductase family protein, partial [Rhodovibrionaceae bacterium]
SPALISQQVAAEGVQTVVVVSDEPDKYPIGTAWAPGVTIKHRDQLDSVQRDLREIEGVSVLIYDQTCAAEKRRRRKRGLYPDPPKRAFINDMVCEGCGDCSVKSNCVSVVPVKTEFGGKRAIDQSSCNKDFSCVNGFCPSFVTVHGGELRKEQRESKAEGVAAWETLPDPKVPELDDPFNIVVTGVGGTGVVTIGALIGMAAHIEEKGCTVLDMAGLAQKGGAVVSHVRIGKTPEEIHAVRVSAGGADLLLGCDMVVAAGQDALAKIDSDKTAVVINSHEAITGDFARDPKYSFPAQGLIDVIQDAADNKAEVIAANEIATALLGDSIASNLFMLGYAWQKGLIPIGHAAIEQAIEINGVAIEFNKQAFLWGRRAAHNLPAVEKVAQPKAPTPTHHLSESLEEVIERRERFLTDYQDTAYAARYTALVAKARSAESAAKPDSSAYSEAVARYAFKLMAYKDEYEVARLYTDGEFMENLQRQFAGDYKLKLHLAPPILAKRDPETGHLRKQEFGAWILPVFKVLAKLKGLRGTKWDIFGYTAERKHERKLIEDYVALIEELSAKLDAENHALAVELAQLPDDIRGYGHIKEASIDRAKARETELLAAFRDPRAAQAQTAAE